MTKTQPAFIVTIDTEEEGLWASKYRSSGYTVENISHVPRFQDLCDRYNVRPTYVIDTPVAEDPRASSILREINDSQRCEIGAHLHPWCAPPHEEPLDERHSYMCNLPVELQRKKLTGLTETIERQFGRRPTSFRAGRYGLDGEGARILIDLGYIVDSSVLPFWNYKSGGGPDYSQAPYLPYRIGRFDLTTPDPSGTMWEVPVTAGFNHTDFRAAAKMSRWVGSGWRKKMRFHSILNRMGMYERWKLSPEQINGRKMNQLVDRHLQQKAPCVVLMFHSSSLAAGSSPYVPNKEKLEQFYADLECVYKHCTQNQNMAPMTLTEFAMTLNENKATPAHSHVEQN